MITRLEEILHRHLKTCILKRFWISNKFFSFHLWRQDIKDSLVFSHIQLVIITWVFYLVGLKWVQCYGILQRSSNIFGVLGCEIILSWGSRRVPSQTSHARCTPLNVRGMYEKTNLNDSLDQKRHIFSN